MRGFNRLTQLRSLIPTIVLVLSLILLGSLISRATSSQGRRLNATTLAGSESQSRNLKEIKDIDSLKITNKTSAFKVSKIKKISGDLFEITYKNEYSKKITGFEVSVGSMRIQTELTLGGDEQEFILSGGTYDKTYTVQESLERDGIQILAVLFDDGTSDGDPKYIKEINDYRLGIKLERERILPMVENLINAKPARVSKALEELEAHITSVLPSREQNSRLNNVELGIRNERRRILEEIKVLKERHQNELHSTQQINQFKARLLSVKQMYKEIIRLASKSLVPQKEIR